MSGAWLTYHSFDNETQERMQARSSEIYKKGGVPPYVVKQVGNSKYLVVDEVVRKKMAINTGLTVGLICLVVFVLYVGKIAAS